MTKQEKIRKGIKGVLSYMKGCTEEEVVCEILATLHSQGLVIIDKDKELPSVFDANEDVISALEYKKKLVDYVAVEPLIKEVTNG